MKILLNILNKYKITIFLILLNLLILSFIEMILGGISFIDALLIIIKYVIIGALIGYIIFPKSRKIINEDIKNIYNKIKKK